MHLKKQSLMRGKSDNVDVDKVVKHSLKYNCMSCFV
jgi:hypothetical protein